MKSTTGNLLKLQDLEFKATRSDTNRKQAAEKLRQGIPEGLLRTFDGFVRRKKKPVALVRHGVCGECHLQIAHGILGSLLFGEGVQQCGNCGRFLFLPEDEPAYGSGLSERSSTAAARKAAVVTRA